MCALDPTHQRGNYKNSQKPSCIFAQSNCTLQTAIVQSHSTGATMNDTALASGDRPRLGHRWLLLFPFVWQAILAPAVNDVAMTPLGRYRIGRRAVHEGEASGVPQLVDEVAAALDPLLGQRHITTRIRGAGERHAAAVETSTKLSVIDTSPKLSGHQAWSLTRQSIRLPGPPQPGSGRPFSPGTAGSGASLRRWDDPGH